MDFISWGLLAKVGYASVAAKDLLEGLEDTAGDILESIVDSVATKLPGTGIDLKKVLKETGAELAKCLALARLDESRQERVRQTAGELLLRYPPTFAELQKADLQAAALADHLIDQDRVLAGGRILAILGREAGEIAACREVLAVLFQRIISQPAVLQAMEGSWRAAVLAKLSGLLEKIDRLDQSEMLRQRLGMALLRSNRPLAFAPGRLSANELLTARHTDLPLRGREKEMQALQSWADAAVALGIRLLTGPGGHGKTRLALELCRVLESEGWLSGFLTDPLPDLSDSDFASLFDPARPTLIVVDYAAGRMQQLRPLFAMALNWPEETRFRLLMIEREAADWWTGRGSLPGAIGKLLSGPACQPEPLRIIALQDQTSPETIYTDAVDSFSRLMKVPSTAVNRPATWESYLTIPLFARARALLDVEAVRAGNAAAAPLTADAVLDALLTREELLWQFERGGGSAAPLSAEMRGWLGLMRKAVALLTLCNRTPANQVDWQLGRLPALTIDKRAEIMECLWPLYGDGGQMGGLEPDLLGERLVDWVLESVPALLDAALGDGSREEARSKSLELLNRLAGRQAEAVQWLEQALDRWFEALAEAALKVALIQPLPMALALRSQLDRLTPALALDLAPLFPVRTTELREIALAVQQTLVLVSLPEDAPLELHAFSAGQLNNLSVRLSALGRREQALDAAQEAVRLFRALAEARPDEFRSNLAMALNNLASSLSDLGQREEALDVVGEAVAIRRAQAEARPDEFRPNLAMALNNLANHLSALGRREEALDTAEEAVEIRRALAEARPDAFRPDLAMSLNNLAKHLSDLGRREEALDTAGEAVAIRRALAEARPDEFCPELASSLNNLAVLLSALGRREEALDAIEEAVDLYRTLAAARPDAFRHDLARSLAVQRGRHRALGRLPEAWADMQEAVTLLVPYFLSLPQAHGGLMTTMLHDYVESAGDAGAEPDWDLLAPVIQALAAHGFIELPDNAPDIE